MNKPAYGPINQIAFVVPDIDAAIKYWNQTLQVGPFFKFPEIMFEKADYRGREFAPRFDAAIAYSGELMIELIKANGPSIFQEFVERGGSGVQHVAAFADDMLKASATIEMRGGRRVQGGTVADGSCIAYFEMNGPQPSIIEIACLTPAVLGLFAAVKAAGAAWDGHTPTISFNESR